MKFAKHIWFYVGLIGAAILFLAVEQWTHWEFLWHIAAIPLEILVAVFIVEKFLENREIKEKRRQLMYIKSYMFRSEMRSLFIADFAALKTPPITMRMIRNASLEELRDMRRRAEKIEYASLEAMEPVIDEYVKAERVWHEFKERAITYDFENVFLDIQPHGRFVLFPEPRLLVEEHTFKPDDRIIVGHLYRNDMDIGSIILRMRIGHCGDYHSPITGNTVYHLCTHPCRNILRSYK